MSTSQQKKKKTTNDYQFYLGSIHQASDFENASAVIINYIKSTFEHGHNIMNMLETLELMDTSLLRSKLLVSKDTKFRNKRIRKWAIQIRLLHRVRLSINVQEYVQNEHVQRLYSTLGILYKRIAAENQKQKRLQDDTYQLD